MKKFLASLFILTVFSAVVFYVGWTQFKVKPDTVGVVVSKTDGVSEIPVVNGEFAWHWQFLLPTNAELKLFTIKPLNVTRTIKGQLPSGEVYTSIYNSSDSFSYYFNFSISLTLSPKAIVELLRLNKISNNDDLQEYLVKAADTLAQLSADYYLKKAEESGSFRPESVRRDDLLRNVQLYKDCPEVDITAFSLVESKIPDYSLYKKLQSGFVSSQFTGDQIPEVDSVKNDSENTDNEDDRGLLF